jgi:hypothetical protein
MFSYKLASVVAALVLTLSAGALHADERDSRLVGTWGHSYLDGSGGVTMRVYEALQLEADGGFALAVRTISNHDGVEVDSGLKIQARGIWKIVDGKLALKMDSVTIEIPYSLSIEGGKSTLTITLGGQVKKLERV